MVKNLALMVYITVGSAAYPILEFLEEWGTENFEVSSIRPYLNNKSVAVIVRFLTGLMFVLILLYTKLFVILFFKEISPTVIPQSTKIFVNGCWVGIHRNPDMLVSTLRRLRRRVSDRS